jgi:hypothetical protein
MEQYNFDLDQEMIKVLSEEFDPLHFVKALGSLGPKDFEHIKASFENYGRNLARRSIEKGEERTDRTYEVMKKVIKKTGEMNFPLIPQRYVEIAYLSIQPFKRLWVLMNSPKVFSYRLNECSIYQALKKEQGEELANRMVCKSACLAMIDEIFSHFGFDIKSSLEVSMADAGNCQFRIEKK